MMMFSNSVALGIVAKIGSKTCIIICEFSKKKKVGLREKWNSFLFSASPKKLEMVSLSSDWLTGYNHRLENHTVYPNYRVVIKTNNYTTHTWQVS